MKLFDHHLESIYEGLLHSDKFYRKKLIVFNSASFCGYTEQLKQFQDIFEQNSVIPIAVPTNEFGGQEPGDDFEIAQYYQHNFGVTFPVTKKIDLNHDFFKSYGKPDWNFNKYVFNEDHKFIKRFGSDVTPLEALRHD
jgi:glutathione peroxidase